MSELVSIVLPTYNGSRFIEESIESVLSQTYTNCRKIRGRRDLRGKSNRPRAPDMPAQKNTRAHPRVRCIRCIRASMPASDEGARAMQTRGRAHRVPNLCRGERRRHTEGRART